MLVFNCICWSWAIFLKFGSCTEEVRRTLSRWTSVILDRYFFFKKLISEKKLSHWIRMWTQTWYLIRLIAIFCVQILNLSTEMVDFGRLSTLHGPPIDEPCTTGAGQVWLREANIACWGLNRNKGWSRRAIEYEKKLPVIYFHQLISLSLDTNNSMCSMLKSSNKKVILIT